MAAAIEVRDVYKRFGELQALSGITLEIPQGESSAARTQRSR